MSDGDISFTFSWVIWISPFFNFCLGTMLMALIFLVTLVVISLAENPLKKWPKICVFFQVQFPASSKKYSTTDRSTKTIKGALGHRDRAFLGDSSSFQWHNENQNLCAKEFRFSCFFFLTIWNCSVKEGAVHCVPPPPDPTLNSGIGINRPCRECHCSSSSPWCQISQPLNFHDPVLSVSPLENSFWEFNQNGIDVNSTTLKLEYVTLRK